MNIHEHQAKDLFRRYGIAASNGAAAFSKEEIDSVIDSLQAEKLVVKAQIHAGGRGKAGGVKLASSKAEAKEHAHNMWGMNLVTPQTSSEGQKVGRIYVEEATDIAGEIYLSAVVDNASDCVTFMASTEGGVDIEEIAASEPEKIITTQVSLTTGIQGYHCRKLGFGLGLSREQVKQFSKMCMSIYRMVVDLDCSQIEINPLVITDGGDLKALDAKVNFDDNGLFRHPEIHEMRDKSEEDPLEVRAGDAELSYVKMDGNIGCMVNGAGLAMATMDIIKYHGGEPANFLDVGGGATQEKVAEAFRIILADKSVRGILINIFGGIMRCDVIARGVVEAAKQLELQTPLVVRLAGTNFELGKEILNDSDLKIEAAEDLTEAAEKIVSATN
jgi:succinyl-CoA synthetase beta subunit